ncbi:MAG: tetratricopeptide repeat protein [Chloroflexota bacterium]
MTSDTDTLTFFLTDIEGSTRNWEASETEMRHALRRHDDLLSRIIPEHGGRVLTERGEGDSFFALFPAASDAVSAALEVQRELDREPWPDHAPVRVRIAIHTGEAGADHRGPEVNRCARLRGLAHGGQVLLSSPTAGLVRGRLPDGASLEDHGLHRLRDLAIPERVFQLVHPDLLAGLPPLASTDSTRHNLPIQATSFVGRRAELATVIALLGNHRLVTLAGSGGAGKTRLALQVATDMLEVFVDGVWLADLAPLSDPALVPATVAAAAGVPEIPGRQRVDMLVEHLSGRTSLLLMDNGEHLVEAVSDLVDQLGRRASELRILVTSREALNVPGEIVWRVPSLSLPEAASTTTTKATTAESIAGFESVQLFRDRAVAVQPAFALTDANAAAVAQICRRLDGVPLAIELAAARVRVLAPDELLRRLEDRFRILTGGSRTALPRQQTLLAAVEWSHDLLSAPERVLFRRLSVFAGGFSLASAEAVCADPPLDREDVLDLLAQLVDKSLVMAEPGRDGSVRYGLLETLRAYGRERLIEAGEADALADVHLRVFMAMAEAAYTRRFDDEVGGLGTLESELENLRAALVRSRAGEADEELRLAGALGWFWSLHTEHASEGRGWLGHALAGREDRTAAVARALTGAAMTANWAGDASEAATFAERAIGIWREFGDDLETGLALEALGWARLFMGDSEAARGPMEEAVACMQRPGDRRLVNRVRVGLGQVFVALNDVAAAEPLARETLAIGRELHASRDIHYSLHFLADCALIRGDGAAAETWYRQSMGAALDYGNVAEAGNEMEGLAMALAAQGRAEQAIRLGAAALAQMNALGFDLSGVDFWTNLKNRYLGPARATLGEPAAAAIDTEGRSMGWEAALAEASAPASGPASAPAGRTTRGRATR